MPIRDRYQYRLPQIANVTHFLTPGLYHEDFIMNKSSAVDLYMKGTLYP